jgi:hypothetical protein
MARHRTHSIEFKRQVAHDFIAGETLHGLAKRHGISRNLIRIYGASPWRPGFVDPLRGGQRRSGIDDARRCARIHAARHPCAVDLAGAELKRLFRASAILTRADQAIPQRCADAALRRAGGDRRTGSFHLFRRLRIYDRRHGLCERRRRMAVIGQGDPASDCRSSKRFVI